MRENYVLDPAKLKKAGLAALLIVAGLFLLYKSLFYFTPFIIAFLLSTFMEPSIRLMVDKMKIPRKIASLISLIFVLGLIGLLLSLLINKAVSELKGVAATLPHYVTDIYRTLSHLTTQGNNFLISLPDEFTEHINEIASSLVTYLTNVLNAFAKSLSSIVISTAISIPGAIVFILTTILSTYLLASGRYEIAAFFKRHLPDDWYDRIVKAKAQIFSSAFKLVTAYLIIMVITFSELLIGFSIMHLKYAFILAILIAVIDLLPILGTGGVVIPWIVYSFIAGDTKAGISLTILYVVVTVIRQIIEPKIVGHQIGTHPLVTLIAMYLGLKLLGAEGLVLGPVAIMILKAVLSGLLKGRTIKDLLFKKTVYTT